MIIQDVLNGKLPPHLFDALSASDKVGIFRDREFNAGFGKSFLGYLNKVFFWNKGATDNEGATDIVLGTSEVLWKAACETPFNNPCKRALMLALALYQARQELNLDLQRDISRALLKQLQEPKAAKRIKLDTATRTMLERYATPPDEKEVDAGVAEDKRVDNTAADNTAADNTVVDNTVVDNTVTTDRSSHLYALKTVLKRIAPFLGQSSQLKYRAHRDAVKSAIFEAEQLETHQTTLTSIRILLLQMQSNADLRAPYIFMNYLLLYEQRVSETLAWREQLLRTEANTDKVNGLAVDACCARQTSLRTDLSFQKTHYRMLPSEESNRALEEKTRRELTFFFFDEPVLLEDPAFPDVEALPVYEPITLEQTQDQLGKIRETEHRLYQRLGHFIVYAYTPELAFLFATLHEQTVKRTVSSRFFYEEADRLFQHQGQFSEQEIAKRIYDTAERCAEDSRVVILSETDPVITLANAIHQLPSSIEQSPSESDEEYVERATAVAELLSKKFIKKWMELVNSPHLERNFFARIQYIVLMRTVFAGARIPDEIAIQLDQLDASVRAQFDTLVSCVAPEMGLRDAVCEYLRDLKKPRHDCAPGRT